MVRQRVRIRFRKQGDLRFVGHRDLMRCLERLFRRAGLTMFMSQGFHPKPRMTFPSALAVGIESTDEIMELGLAESSAGEHLLARLNAHAFPGLSFKSVEALPEGSKKARVRSVTYQAPVPPDRRGGLSERIDRLMAGSCPLLQRTDRSETVDLHPLLEELTLRDGMLSMRLRTGSRGSLRPDEVLAALGLGELPLQGAPLRRTAVEIEP